MEKLRYNPIEMGFFILQIRSNGSAHLMEIKRRWNYKTERDGILVSKSDIEETRRFVYRYNLEFLRKKYILN